MKTFCEIMSQYMLPGIRALIARDLMEVHNLTQKEAAKKLGTTQPAISQYKKKIRGTKAKILENDKKIDKKISSISEVMANEEISKEDFVNELCEICGVIKSKYGKHPEKIFKN